MISSGGGSIDPLEAVRGHVVAALRLLPAIRVRDGQAEDRGDDLAEHRAEVRAGVLRVVDLRAEPRLADGEAAVERQRGHPDVDAELRDLGRPVALGEVVLDEVAGHAEVAADRLADPQPVERAGQRVRDVVRDRAVVLVAGVQRGDVVVAALEDRPGQELDPLRTDRAQVGVDDDERLDLERRRDLEERPQRGALAAGALDLGVRERDPRELVGRPNEQDPLDVVGRLGLDDDPPGPVRRARIGVHDDRAEVGEVLHEAGLGRAHDIADRRGVLEAGDADHDVRSFESVDLFADGRRQHRLRHPAHRTTDAPIGPLQACDAHVCAMHNARGRVRDEPVGAARWADDERARPRRRRMVPVRLREHDLLVRGRVRRDRAVARLRASDSASGTATSS